MTEPTPERFWHYRPMEQPAVVAAVPAACTRCGTFLQTSLEVGEHRWCPACAEVLKRDLRLWPHGYVLGVGALLNVVPATILLALNWRRLKLPGRERAMWIAAAFGALVYVGLMLSDVRGIGCGINIAVTYFLAREYGAVWKGLKQAGFRRANVVLPVVFTILAIFAVAVVLLLATGGFDEELY